MQKFLLLFIVLCLHVAARGQTISNLDELDLSGLPQPTQAKALRYWFDDDGNSVETLNEFSDWQLLNVTSLLDGLHTLHYQIVDDANVVTIPRSTVFLKVDSRQAGMPAKHLRYWFDDDPATVTTAVSSVGVHNIDVHLLTDGLHTLHYQVIGTDEDVYSIASGLFFKMEESDAHADVTAKKLIYWFDDESNQKTVDVAGGVQMLDASDLNDGLHTIHYQVLCSNEQMTSAMSSVFLRVNYNDEFTTAKLLQYWFDNETTATEVALEDGVQMLDASRLEEGLHIIHYQIVDNKEQLSSPVSALFLKMQDQNSVASAKSLRYWIDDNVVSATVVNVNKGTQTIDVAALPTGLHTLYYQLVDSNGQASTPISQIFMRDFDRQAIDGGNRITRYQYWLNRNSQTLQTVELGEVDNPYTLVGLLPMQKEPIQTSLFHFEITEDIPIIYAKNMFHVRFHDAQGYFSDKEKAFVDYGVRQEVTDVELLESGVRQTTAKPEANTIKWYKVTAEIGDSLQFKLDRAATIQLFSPSGKEVYSASGNQSVTVGGIHAYEDGTYYLALHDVTGTQNPNISVDYQKIDRYAILAYSPNVIGVPSEAVVNLIGNGFDASAKVSLFKDGIDYWAKSIHTEKISELSAMFDFDDIPCGKYGLKVLYTPEDSVCIANAVTIEEADTISDISIKLEGNPYFIAGGTANYSIRITNNSNLAVFSLPVTLSIECEGDINNVPYLKFDEDYSGPSRQSLNNTFKDILSPSELKELENYIFGDCDLSMFYVDTLSHPGKAFLVGNFVIPQLEGNSSITMPFTLKKVNHNLTLYAATQPHWSKGDFINLEAQYANGTRKRAARRSAQSLGCADPCSMGVVATCIVTITESAMPVGFSELLGDCIKGYVKDKFGGIFSDIICNGEEPDFSKLPKTPAPVLEDIVVSLWDCASENMIKQGVVKLFGKAVAGKILKVYSVAKDCVYEPLKTFAGGCPGDGDGGSAQPIHSYDPNEMYGYIAESGSKAVKDGQSELHYTIQFENDTTFATAAAHNVYLTDTLDAKKFDFSTYMPTRIKIGEKTAELSGEQNFVTTVDMRPEINAIAQVEGTYDEKKGIARWHISSLDPMTMEPTEYVMDGVLPVNTNGQGIGEVSYDISLKSGLLHGTEISNRAGIVFDSNDVIMTPVWTNVIDRIAPESHITDVQMLNDSTASVRIKASDELSGPWRYNVYVQYGSGAWFKAAENVPVDTTASVKVYEGIDHGFYVVITDSAGNVEQKNAEREYTFEVFGSQVDTNTKLELAQGWNWMSHNQQEPLPVTALQPAGARMVGQTEELYNDTRFGWMGDLEELLPTQMYKLQLDEPTEVQLSGRLFNASFRSIPLYQGWNWMGYPVANTMAPAEALAKLEAEEGDMLIGQDGLATYSDGQWQGTLTTMNPGEGYMFFSQSDKNLFLNASAQASSRRADTERNRVNSAELPDGWSVDKHKYPNVMGVIAQLWNGQMQENVAEWVLAAFCGNECRGIGQPVGEVMMMNVYGSGGEQIGFRVMNIETGEVLGVSNQEAFHPEVLGTMAQPYQLTMGEPTGIKSVSESSLPTAIYDLMGRRLQPSTPLGKGIYVVTDSENKTIQKVIRK